MSDKRIIDLEESTKIESGDYLAIDSNAGGTCKANAGIITDQFSDMQNVLGSKNELPNTAESKVDHGLTFTVNSDGSVKVNGTATADTYYTIGEVTLKAGTYILSGCYAGGGISNWRIYIFNNSGGATIASDYGNGVEFTLAVDTKVTASILVMNTKSLSNAMFYPMIRPAAVADSTYVPYAKTNKELTDDVASINDALSDLSNRFVTEQYTTTASSAAGHSWSKSVTKSGYIALAVANGSGYGYSVQPVIEGLTGLGTSSITVNGTASNQTSTDQIRIWVLWFKV